MRTSTSWFLVLPLLAACGGGGSKGDDDDDDAEVDAGDDEQPGDAFEIVTKEITIAAGDERTHCYYDTIPVDFALGVKRWTSKMSLGSHHMIVYALASGGEPDGTLEEDCNVLGGAGVSGLPAWSYSAQTPEADFVMPEGVGIKLGANQKIVIEMHYLNATTAPLDAHVELTGEYFAEGEEFTPAAAYITYDSTISIPAGVGQEGTGGGSCALPDDAQFFALSTHAHRRAVLTRVTDGEDMVFESDNWDHPGVVQWDTGEFYAFGGNLDYHCDFVNDRGQTTTDGPSAETDEMCMAVGYFFPAEKAKFCIDSTVLPF
jgi:hypothetical protein